LSFVVAAGDRGVKARALILIEIVTIVDDGQVNFGAFGRVVGFVQLQPTLMNLRLELQHDAWSSLRTR
jgi:hypothetical protein